MLEAIIVLLVIDILLTGGLELLRTHREAEMLEWLERNGGQAIAARNDLRQIAKCLAESGTSA